MADTEEKAILQINLADLTEVPPIIAQILLNGLPYPTVSCTGKNVDDCYAETIAPRERAEAIADILNGKGIRARVKKYG